MYLRLGLFQHPAVQRPIVRGAAVFAVGAATETLQHFGVPLFGRTFDPLDYLAFAAGVGIGVRLEGVVKRKGENEKHEMG